LKTSVHEQLLPLTVNAVSVCSLVHVLLMCIGRHHVVHSFTSQVVMETSRGTSLSVQCFVYIPFLIFIVKSYE